jgi:ribosome-binding factor A
LSMEGPRDFPSPAAASCQASCSSKEGAGAITPMPTRRQEKFARLIKEAVSDAIHQGLNDPRITGFVSVTRVHVSADLRNAEVFISIFGGDQTSQKLTFEAIEHGRSRIQSLTADKIDSRFCPVLHLKMDEAFKKTLETIKLIDEASRQLRDKSRMQPGNDL